MSNILNLRSRFSCRANRVNRLLGVFDFASLSVGWGVFQMTPRNSPDYLLNATEGHSKLSGDCLNVSSSAIHSPHLNNLEFSGLGQIVFRPAWAIWKNGLGMLFTFGLPSLFNHIGRVVLAGSEKQVAGVTARRIVAFVKHIERRFDSVMELVSKPVCGHLLPIKTGRPISLVGFASHPNPTRPKFGFVFRNWTVLINFFPESIWGLFWSSHSSIATPITPGVKSARIGGTGNDRRKFVEHSFFAATSMPC